MRPSRSWCQFYSILAGFFNLFSDTEERKTRDWSLLRHCSLLSDILIYIYSLCIASRFNQDCRYKNHATLKQICMETVKHAHKYI